METGMFVMKFDFQDTKVDDGLTPSTAGAASSGVGITTFCKHWRKEAKDKMGEGMSLERRKDMFIPAKLCFKCKYEKDKRAEMQESVVDSEEIDDVGSMGADLEINDEYFIEELKEKTKKLQDSKKPVKTQ